MPPRNPHLLVFGATGAIGSAILEAASRRQWAVAGAARNAAGTPWISIDPFDAGFSPEILRRDEPYTAVCWAQGANATDSVFDVDRDKHTALYQANCLFVLEMLKLLLARELLAPAARLVVISSIWQNIARQSKLSYIMTKAAIGGLVQSASVDLAARGIFINAVLPSAIDTPMTAANLSAAQLENLAGATGFNRLVSLDEVVAAIEFLCVETGMTGQSLTVDLGFSHARLV